MCETQMHDKSCYVTFTYDDAHLPADRSLNLRHWQLFAKRLRKRKGPFRFYHCGEYGPETLRPHLHAIIWGLDFTKDQTFLTTSNGLPLYHSELLDSLWKMGSCQIGEVTYESSAYVARYIMDKLNGKKAIPRYEERVCQDTGEIEPYYKPPYTSMSTNRGIAHSWFQKYRSDVFPRDEHLVNGKLCRPPKFFDYVEALTNPEGMDDIKAKRVLQAMKHSDNNTPERLADREIILDRRLSRLPRRTL